MTETSTLPTIRAQQWATRAAFLLAGVGVSAWAPLVPFAKGRLGVDDGRLGLLLLCVGVGSVIGMPAAGGLAGRYGCRRVIAASALAMAAVLPVLATAGHPWVMAAALAWFGAAVGTLDVAMNVHAVLVERDSGGAMMSGFHGLYSGGGIAGAAAVGGLVWAGLPPLAAVVVAAVGVVALLVAAYPSLRDDRGGGGGGPVFAVARGRVLLLGGFCFVLFLAEGSVLDWGAVFLTTVRGMAKGRAGVGYVAFSVAMTVCRLSGDRIVAAAGPGRVVLLGSACAAAGFALAVAVPSAVAGVVGFGLVGLGASNVVPVMFTAAGRQADMPAHLAVSAMTTLGYAGILAGPAVVGLVASRVGLPAGLAAVAVGLIVVAVTSTRVRW